MLARRIRSVSEPLIDTLNRRTRALVARGVDVISLGQALPGLPPPRAAIAAARRALDRPETHVYSPDAGRPELQRAIARWIARHDGFHVDPDTQILVSAGANQALLLALQCVVDAGARVLLPSPYFMSHEMAVRLVDAVPVEVTTEASEEWMVTGQRLFESRHGRPKGLRDAAGYKAAVLTTPSNPTGAVVSPIELRRIQRECARRGITLIVDRTYAGYEFERQPEPARLRRLPENVVLIGSFSKAFGMTGWRVGFLAGSAALIREALKAQDTTIICAPTIGQIAAAAALEARASVAPAFIRELRHRRDYVQERIAGIDGWSAVPAAGGFFAFVRIAGLKDSVAFAFHLLDKAHVLVMPGRIFGGAGEGHIRISYGVADVPTLKRAFDRIVEPSC